MKVVWLLTTLACLSLFTQPKAWADDTLTDVLLEKEVITKEEWIRIEADREKRDQEQNQRLDQEFPVAVGYGQSGFEFKTKDGNLPHKFNGGSKVTGLIPQTRILSLLKISMKAHRVPFNCDGFE